MRSNSLDVLRVTGGAKNSEITVTYTPKDVIYIDQYYDNGSSLVKWNNTHITLNGPELLNGAAEAAVIEKTVLTDDMKDYRFLTVDGVTYDFSFASLVPRKDDTWVITDLWYKDEADPLGYHWFYSHSGKTASFPFGKTELSKGSVNFCYNTPHSQSSKHHDFVATTVDPTCTEQGYTDFECRYCGKEGQREYIPSLGGHLWGDYEHDKNTKEKDSQHYQVCKREGCNATSTPVGCNFVDTSIETGTRHTCKDCGYYYDESAPKTETVYVYFRTVDSADIDIDNVEGVTYNNDDSDPPHHWATLGKLETKTSVTDSVYEALGQEVAAQTGFKYYTGNTGNNSFPLNLITWEKVSTHNGAQDYVSPGTDVWHLDGKVTAYRVTYNANPPAGVAEEAVTGMPKPAYYLPDREAPVSKVVPTLQGYNFEGWYTEETFEHKVEKTVTVSKDTVLYAKWTPAQPTTDFGSVVITTTKPELKETVDLSGGAYEVPYTATYTMSDKLFKMLKAAPSGVPMTFVVELDSRLTAKKGADGKFLYDFDGDGVLNVDKSQIKVSADGHTITVVCTPVDNWRKALEGKTSVVMKLDGTGVLAATGFDAGKYLNTTGHIEGAIPVGSTLLSVKIPANVCQTKMTAQTYTVTYDGNGADSGETTDTNAYTRGTVATVKANGFTRSKYTFTGWNTSANGSGRPYAKGDQITMTDNVVLYAQWTRNSSRDDDDKYFFAIQKVDAQDGHALNDAKFELYQLDKDGEVVNRRVTTTRRHSSENGIALFSVSATKTSNGGSTWYYREITAPEGYVLDTKEYEISARDFYYDDQSKAVAKAKTVRNYRGTTPDLLNDSDHFAYVIGYMDGNVRPYGLISRAETTTIFFRLLKDSVRDGNLLTSNTYTDVPDDYWANTAISTMTGLGIVQGRSTTTFDPKAPITRAQFAAICARFDTGKSNGEQTFSDIQGHWAEKYIERAAELGWIKGFEDGTFRPDTYITRAQAMTMINRVLNRIPEENSDLLPGMNVWPDCNPGDWFYLAVQEATNSHDFEHKAGNYETWTGMNKDPDWTRYEN